MTDERRESDESAPLPETWLAMARSSYHPPRSAPRDEIWEGIQRALHESSAGGEAPSRPAAWANTHPTRRHGLRLPRWSALLAAASVALLLGVGLGRWSADPGSVGPEGGPVDATSPVASAAGSEVRRPESPSPSVRFATARHLTDVEALLSLVQVDARQARVDQAVGVWGRELLTDTRLLLDSPASNDPAVRGVLEDLELVLAQIALLADPRATPERLRGELELIALGVAEGGVRARLQSVLPSVDRMHASADD